MFIQMAQKMERRLDVLLSVITILLKLDFQIVLLFSQQKFRPLIWLFVIYLSKFKNFIIFSDSLSVLQSLKNRNLSNPLIQQLLLKHHNLSSSINIVFCWLPSHIGIQGNEKADIAAKHSLNLDVVGKLKLPCSDLKPCINKYIVSKWQHEWDGCRQNKLHSIKPILGESLLVCRSVRREEVVLSRCRIGLSSRTHVYLLRREEQPECVFCQEPITIKHLLLDCADLIDTRVKYFKCLTMKELFSTVSVDVILSFLKETRLYSKI